MEPKREARKTGLFCGIFVVLLIASALATVRYGDLITEEQTFQYWTNDVIPEFINIPVKNGEIVQTFTAGYSHLEQFILFFDHYSAEDDAVLSVILDDNKGKVYYSWNANTNVLGGETFCLIAPVENKLRAHGKYNIRIRLEGSDSDVTVRGITSEEAHSSLGGLTVGEKKDENTVLYLCQQYKMFFSYVWLWGGLLIFTLSALLMILFDKKGYCLRIWKIVGKCLLLFAGYYCMESLTGYFTSISILYGMLNGLLLLGCYLVIRAVLLRKAYYFSALLFLIVAIANYYVLQFRGSNLLFSDIRSLSTAMSVAGTYEYAVPPAVFTTILITACLILLQSAADISGGEAYRKPTFLKRTVSAAGGIGVILLVGVLCTWTDFYFFSLNKSFAKYGWYYSNLCVWKSSSLDKPDNYNDKYVESILAEIEEPDDGRENIQPVNLIVIMNESFSDPKIVGEFNTNRDFMPFIHGLEENTVKGNLHVSTFGGNTCITEYEFLTGNSEELLPQGAVPYSNLCRDSEEGMVKILKDQGYYAVAMHPYGAANWNRDTVYPAFGFDEFWDIEDYQDAGLIRKYVSDEADYQKIIDYYENYDREENLFIFNVTMQNHGGFDLNNGVIDTTVTIEDFESSVGETYLSLIYESDRAFEYLLSYFSEVEEPTMIVLFGDHLPSLPNSFYEDVYGKKLEDLTDEEASRQYMTPYIIWTNYDSDFEKISDISANYLGSYVLECAELEMPEYNAFLLNQRAYIPVVGKMGVYDENGQFVAYKDMSKGTLNDYKILQYIRVKDRNSKYYNIFRMDK